MVKAKKLVKLVRVTKNGVETVSERSSAVAKMLLEHRKFEDEPNPNYSTFKKYNAPKAEKKVVEEIEEEDDENEDGTVNYDKLTYNALVKAYSEEFNVPGTGIKKVELLKSLKAGKIAES